MTGGSEVTINKSGTNWFRVTYDVSLDSPTGTSRTSSRAELQVNTTAVPGSQSFGYHRTSASAEDTLTCSKLVQLTLNDVVRVQAVRIAGGDTLTTIANGCRLTIESIDAP